MAREIELHWEITNNCNLRCKHCIIQAGEKDINEISYDEVTSFIDKILNSGLRKILFTGGEPFTRKDFKDILQYCINKNVKVEIVTNATLINNDMLDFIKKNGVELGISIESFKKEIFEAIRGKNTFDYTMATLKKSKEMGIPSKIYTTLTKLNINEIDELVKNAHDLGLGIHFNDVTMDGRAKANANDLGVEDNQDIAEIISGASEKYYDDSLMQAEDDCWADADILFINSKGNIYLCTEICRTTTNGYIGNIHSFPIEEWYLKIGKFSCTGIFNKCPYRVYFNEYITYTSNVDCECPFVGKSDNVVSDIDSLGREFDKLYKDIRNDCKNCKYPDCMGFMWLLNEEMEKLYARDINILTINEDINFINVLEKYDLDNLDFSKITYPECPHRNPESGCCGIHEVRPLVCHMYPIGLETSNTGIDIWVLHDDCLFVQNLIKNGKLNEFIVKAIKVIDRISVELEMDIKNTYRKVDEISCFPNGENSYIVLKEVN